LSSPPGSVMAFTARSDVLPMRAVGAAKAGDATAAPATDPVAEPEGKTGTAPAAADDWRVPGTRLGKKALACCEVDCKECRKPDRVGDAWMDDDAADAPDVEVARGC